jgi:hypothetical protein
MRKAVPMYLQPQAARGRYKIIGILDPMGKQYNVIITAKKPSFLDFSIPCFSNIHKCMAKYVLKH